MAETTSQILIRLLSSGDLTALERGKAQSESLKVSLEGLRSVMGLLGTGLSLGALVEGSRAMLEYGANIKNLSEAAGISTEAFQKLSYTAATAGLKQEELGGALNVLQRNMAQAADGATKQNQAITDLGLNTAELLAMPVEQQIEAIAQAYVGATNKAKAWADITALLGKNSAALKGVLIELGEKGLNGIDFGKIITDADIQRLDKAENAFGKIWMSLKAASATGFVQVMSGIDKFAAYEVPWKRGEAAAAEAKKGDFHGDGTGQMSAEDFDPKVKAAKIAAINDELNATIQGSPQMVSARQAMAKAILDERNAYESATDAAKRLRAEAATDEEQAAKLAANKFDATSQLEAVKLRTEASKLRAAANAQDAKSAREIASFAAAEAEMGARRLQEATKLLPLAQQLNAASDHKLQVELALAALDVKSLTYKQDHLKLEGDLLAVDREITALKEKDAEAYVQGMIKQHEIDDRREAIALSMIEHDLNLTDAQKWEEKRAILARVVAAQETYIANMSAIANSDKMPQGARDKAGQAAGAGINALAGTHDALLSQGADPNDLTAQINSGLREAIRHADTLAQAIGHGVGNSVTQINNGIKSWLNGTQTFKSAMMGAWQHIWMDFASRAEDAFLSMLENYALSKAQMFAVDTVMAAKGLLLSAASAAKSLIMWLPSAIAASISSYGLAAAIGTAAAIAAIVGMAGGFEEGGYTGGREGEPAGVVHGNEFVWSAPAVRAIGVGNLERAHQAALSGGGGASVGGGASGRASGNIILAMSPEDVARSQRNHVDARVQRMSGKMPGARYSL